MTASPASLQPHERLDRMMRSARALLWEAEVTRDDSGFHWQIQVADEAAAQNWLPVERLPGNAFTDDFYRVRTPQTKRTNDALAQHALESGAPSYQQEFLIPLANGTERWLREDVQIERLAVAHWHLVGVCLDVTERRHSEESLYFNAHHDSLTGLPNRLSLIQCLETALQEEKAPTLFFLDLDNFKEVNDSLGHPVGDRVLKAVAERLRRALPEEALLMRLGGDEFTVFFAEALSEEHQAQWASTLLEALRTPLLVERRTFVLTGSLGIASGPVSSAAELLRRADTAMYHAKRQGPGQIAPYTPSLERRTKTRQDLEQELRRAMENGQLTAYYQPLVDLQTGQTVQLEALARWNHPERGLVSPADFIPLAEETGLILPLGEHLLREACQAAAQWQRQGLPVGVSVNVSLMQTLAPGFVEGVARTLSEAELEPASLQLEFSESTLMSDPEGHQQLFCALRRQGIALALDDFGTGYCSLSYLCQVPIGMLKLDRRVVTQLPSSTVAIQSTLALAGVQGRKVTVLGIETDTQLSLVKRLGAHYGQGFYLARPLSSTEATRFLQARNPRRRRAA